VWFAIGGGFGDCALVLVGVRDTSRAMVAAVGMVRRWNMGPCPIGGEGVERALCCIMCQAA